MSTLDTALAGAAVRAKAPRRRPKLAETWWRHVVGVVACVVARDHADPPTLDDVRAFVRERLGATKAPKELRIVDTIPRSPSGKALRRLL